MAKVVSKVDEMMILSRAVRPDAGDWPADIAQAVLKIALAEKDRDRMNALAEHARAGSLSNDEEVEIETYRQATSFMELLKAKARVSIVRTQSVA